jgi:hypothetical protein
MVAEQRERRGMRRLTEQPDRIAGGLKRPALGHSAFNTCTGSVASARRTGMQAAASAERMVTAAVSVKSRGSRGSVRAGRAR